MATNKNGKRLGKGWSGVMMGGMCGNHRSKTAVWHALLLPLHTWEMRLASDFWKNTLDCDRGEVTLWKNLAGRGRNSVCQW